MTTPLKKADDDPAAVTGDIVRLAADIGCEAFLLPQGEAQREAVDRPHRAPRRPARRGCPPHPAERSSAAARNQRRTAPLRPHRPRYRDPPCRRPLPLPPYRPDPPAPLCSFRRGANGAAAAAAPFRATAAVTSARPSSCSRRKGRRMRSPISSPRPGSGTSPSSANPRPSMPWSGRDGSATAFWNTPSPSPNSA